MSTSAALRCPHCAEALSHEVEWPNAVAACSRCGGVWLDNSATAELLENRGAPVVELAREAGETAASASRDTGKQRPCAACSHPMLMTRLTAAGIQVDVCSEHGTWFDRGEIERLASAVEAGMRIGSEDEPKTVRTGASPGALAWVLKEVRGLFASRS